MKEQDRNLLGSIARFNSIMRYFLFLVLSIFLVSLVACDTALGRAIGGEDDGGAIEMPSPPESRVIYKVSGKLDTPAPDVDKWTFQGEKGHTAEIHLETAPGAITTIDTLLLLEGPNGEEIASNDDYNGVHAGIVTVLPESGQYTVVARGYGLAFGPYELTLFFEGAYVDNDGGKIAETDASGLSVSYGEIQIGTDEDTWEIPVLKGDTLVIALDGITYLDPILTLLDPDGVRVAYSDDYVGQDAQITYVAEKDGVHLAIARGYGGKSTGDYRLTISGNPERSILNSITDNLMRIEAELAASGELAAAAATAELAEAAEIAEYHADREQREADLASIVAEEAERASAGADMALGIAKRARDDAKYKLEELTDLSENLDEMVVNDIESLEKVAADSNAAYEATQTAEDRVAELEAELRELRESKAESDRILEMTEARLEALAERQRAATESQTTRLAEAETLARLAKNAESAAKAEVGTQAARAELAQRSATAVKAELDALSASIAEKAAQEDLARQSREAAEAEAIAKSAVSSAKESVSESLLITVIEGGYVGVSTPEHGTASVVDGEIYYTHNGSSNAVDSFTATVKGEDGELLDVRMWVTLTYLKPNSAPVAADDSISIESGGASPIILTANDTDVDGHDLKITHINGTPLSPGETLNLSETANVVLCDDAFCGAIANGVVYYSTHLGNFSGQDTFTYTLSDENGLSAVGTVIVDLTTDYKFPVALEQNIQTQQGATSKYVLTGVPTSSSIDSVTQGNYGSVEILDKDSVKYSHTGFRDASDIFTYTVRDEFGAKASGNVNVVVEITNSVPTPQNVTASVDEGETVHIPVTGVLSGFTPEQLDPESDILRPTREDSIFYTDPTAIQPSNGSYIYKPIVDSETGEITGYHLQYTHDGSETTQDTFNYELVQEDGGAGRGTMTINVAPVNDIPLALNYSLDVDQGNSVNVDVVDSDTDPDGPELQVEIVTSPEYGSVAMDGSNLTYTHGGSSSDDSFEYSLDDGQGGHPVTAIVKITVNLAFLDVAAASLPSPAQDKVPWDPEIGIRISSSDNLTIRNLDGAFSLYECFDAVCEDSQLTPVTGQTKQLGETSSQILSFIPEVPLYGNTTYKVSVNSDSGVELAGGNLQKLSGLIGDVNSWTFTTAEMTRFTIPLLVTYSDSECRGAQEPKIANRIGESLCLTLDEIDELLYGMEEDKPSHYFDSMSSGKFVVSPIRDRAGHVVKSFQIDRNKPYIGGNCGRHFEKEGLKAFSGCPDYDQDTTLRAEMDLLFDRFRYRNITHKNGSYNLLAPYLPTREATISNFGIGGEQDKLGNGQHYFRNITPIYVWGVGGPDSSPWSTIGMASPPTGSQQTALDISHEETHRTWGHELGHAYFGLPDYYYTGSPGPNKTGPLDIMGDRSGHSFGKQWPPFTAWSLVKSEFEDPDQLFDDSDLISYIDNSSDNAPSGTAAMYSKSHSSGFNIIKVPAIIERDTRLVRGYYLLELYGSTGYDSQIYVNSDTVNFTDNPGAFPGGIAIWKWDKTEQKVRTDVCKQYFTNLPKCDFGFLFQNGNHSDIIEYYPSIPSITSGNDSNDATHGRSPGIYNLFPWWYSPQLPYGANYEDDLSKMPTTIELPVLEIAPFAEDPNFGGGSRVATVTLSFDQLVGDIKTGIQSASSSGNIDNLAGYTFGDTATFTYNVEKHQTPESMTYKDHVREGQVQFASGAMWDEMQAYGYFRFQEVPDQ